MSQRDDAGLPGGEDAAVSQGLFGRSRAALGQLGAALAADGRSATARSRLWLQRLAKRRQAERSGEADGLEPEEAKETEPARSASSTFAGLTHRVGATAAWGWPGFSRRPKLVSFLIAGTLGSLAAVVLVLVWALHDVPWREIARGTLEPVVVLETADGEPLVTQGAYRGAYAGFEDFPDHLIAAVTTVEDRRFFDHFGLDLRGIGRALVRNVIAGEVVEGGSTITQQLVKVSYLERERTLKRKIQEAVIALWLDARLSKQEILTRYLNAIYLGSGATGVPAAARIYFDKEVQDLSPAESAMIAGMIRAPSLLNPIDDPQAARQRAEFVLDQMAATGALEADEVAQAKTDFGAVRPHRPEERAGSWFADWALAGAREIAGGFAGTVRVRTTLVPYLQSLAERAVREALDEFGRAHGVSQAALVAMTPDGAVVAMVGGRDYGESSFNRAVDAKRQPGSTFKLFVYHAALRAGLSPRTRIEDERVEIDGWSPENFGGKYNGRVSIAEAFARSLNAATVNLAMEVGLDKVIASARDLGIDAPLAETPAVALGASEISLLDLTGAYASVRAGVAPVEPYGIAAFRVEGAGQEFRVLPEERPRIELGSEQDQLVGLLRLAVERGTGREARMDVFTAGKTGTSQDHRDAWFVGFTEPLVVGVWVGNDDDSPMQDVTGGGLPAIIWRRFMEAALDGPPRQPDGLEASSASETLAPPACNVRACQRAYRSFRASDCTFQPYSGPRKLCEK